MDALNLYALICRILATSAAFFIVLGPFAGLLVFSRALRPREFRFLFEVIVNPVLEKDRERLVQALPAIAEEQDTYLILEGAVPRIIVQAVIEPQVETLLDKLNAEHQIAVVLGEPSIIYRYRGVSWRGEPLLWEPIMLFRVETPEKSADEVERDFRNRGGRVSDTVDRKDGRLICALVPLKDMFGYTKTLESISQGRASYSVSFDHFSPLPPDEGDPPKQPAMIMRQ